MNINIEKATVELKHPYTINIEGAIVPNNYHVEFKLVANSVEGFPYNLESKQRKNLEDALKNIFGNGTKIRNQADVDKCLAKDNVIEFDY